MEKLASYRWKMLALIYLCMFSFAIVFQSIPPLLSIIIPEFGISHAAAGLLMSLFALPGIFVALPGGIISDQFGMKKTGVASLILMIVGTYIVGTGNTVLQVYIGRIISGIGGLTLVVVLPNLLSKWFLGKELVVAMGIFNTAMPLGIIFTFNFFGNFSMNVGWQTPIFFTTGISILALLFFLLVFREPAKMTEIVRSSVTRDITKLGLPIWFIGFSWMWFNATIISFITFSSDFLVANGHEIASAGFLSSTVMIGSLLMSPMMGYVIYKLGKEKIFMGFGGIFIAFLIFLFPNSSRVVPLLVLVGIFAALVPTPTFSLPPKTIKPENLGLAYGIITACAYLGVLGGPYIVGLARDLSGEYTLSFSLISLFAILQVITIGLYSLFMGINNARERKNINSELP